MPSFSYVLRAIGLSYRSWGHVSIIPLDLSIFVKSARSDWNGIYNLRSSFAIEGRGDWSLLAKHGRPNIYSSIEGSLTIKCHFLLVDAGVGLWFWTSLNWARTASDRFLLALSSKYKGSYRDFSDLSHSPKWRLGCSCQDARRWKKQGVWFVSIPIHLLVALYQIWATCFIYNIFQWVLKDINPIMWLEWSWTLKYIDCIHH